MQYFSRRRRSFPVSFSKAAALVLLFAVASSTAARASSEERAEAAEPAATASAVPTSPPSPVSFLVSFVTGDRVYVDAGRHQGLSEGTELDVVREGESIAEVEVEYLSDRSASCRVVASTDPPRKGDRVVPTSPLAAVAEVEPPPPRVQPTSNRPTQPAATEKVRAPAPVRTRTPRPPPVPTTKVSGTVALDYRLFQDDGLYDRSFDETGLRLSLRVSDISGGPWNVRARVRGREISRDRDWSASNPASERDDRLYELSLRYQPHSDNLVAMFGRLGTSPFIGLGYLDGGLVQFRVSGHNHLGAFGGAESEIDSLGFKSEGEKYGAYYRYAISDPDSPVLADIVVAGVGEYLDGDPSREYFAVDARLRGTRWYLFERAEVDLNRDWRREVTDRSSQLSMLSLSSSYQVSSAWRWTASYDQFRRYWDADTRNTPEERFDRLLRQGFRTGFNFTGGRSLRATAAVGLRQRRGTEQRTVSFLGNILVLTRSRFSYGMSFSMYGGDVSDGYLLSVRLRRSFRSGHDIELSAGHTSSSVAQQTTDRSNSWIRLGGQLKLPYRLFIRLEVERLTGDDTEGTRARSSLGYRF